MSQEYRGDNGPALEPPPPLEVYYMKLNEDQVDARLGKKRAGDIVALDKEKATRYAQVGIAEQVPYSEFAGQQERRDQRMTKRQERFAALNQGYDAWDVSTYRDVLTAPESGLRIAVERGIPLVNVHMLRDEDGEVLPPDADIEEILEARQYLHADLTAPLAAHDRSSVMGGGSPYTQNVPGGPMPLTPRHREMAERIEQHERFANTPQALQIDREPRTPPGRAGAAQRRAQTMRPETHDVSLEPSGPPTPPPPRPAASGGRRSTPANSPQAAEEAKAHDVPPPKEGSAFTEEQQGN